MVKSESRPERDYTDHAADAVAQLIPDADLSTLAVTMRLRRLVKELDRAVARVIESTPLSAFGDYQVLAVLHRSPDPLQPSEIATSLKLTRSGMTGRLHRLEELELITRDQHPDDARGALISVTPEGARLADQIFELGQRAQAAAFTGLDDQERRNLADALRTALIAVMDTPD